MAFALFLLAWAGGAQGQVAGIHREIYLNLSREGFSLGRLTNHPNFLAGRPDQTNIVASLQTESGRGEDYGQRLRGWVTAPTTGNYAFWIASDETSNLYLSTNEYPSAKQLIAWVDPRSQPGNYATHHGQQSAMIPLQAGRRYYIEVVHHEANLIDHLSVQWRLPAGTVENPIPNTRLVYEIPPRITADLANVTVEEGRRVEFKPELANFLPQSFRWQRNGADIPGATNRSHSLEAAALSDNGALFRAFVTNRVGMTNTTEALLTVLRDTNAPGVTSVLNANQTAIFVTFSEPVAASALDSNHYSIPGASVTSAEFGNDGSTVILTTSPLAFQSSYTLRISNVLDRASAANVLVGTQVVFVTQEFNAQSVGITQPGSVVPAPAGVDVTSRGASIGGRADEFQFAWQSVAGDFDFRVRVEGVDFVDVWTRAGLMARENLNADSRFAGVMATPTLAGCFFQYRTNGGGFTTSSGSYPASFPNMWLRLRRAGAQFSGFASQDGFNWAQLGLASMAASNRLYLGFVVSSHNTNQAATAQFRDFSGVSGGTVDQQAPRAEPLGPSSRKTGLVISELMYHPHDVLLGTNKAELEFVELFNSNPFYEEIGGYRFSGDIDYTFPSGTIIEGGSFLVVARAPADVAAVYGLSGVLGPYTNNLPNNGGRIRLRNNNGFVLLEVNYESESPWPIAADGAGHSLVLARPSYGENQRAAWAASDSAGGSPGRIEPMSAESLRAIVINEFLAHTDAPVLDFVELHNHSLQPVDVGGAWLTDNPSTNKFRIPSPTVIPPRGFVSFDQNQLGFSLSSAGERILLVNSNETRVIDSIGFAAQANGISFGRFPDGAPALQELGEPTPAMPNATARTQDIVINEIMYHPISENSDDEYIELFNKGPAAVNLGGWRFPDGISFRFPSNTVIGAGGYLVVAKNRTNLLARYPNLMANPTLVVGDYDGNLANDGERIALARPEVAINADNPQNVVTNIIYVVVDEVEYRDGGRWGQWSDGGGSSLELTDPRADNRLAPNWADSDETGKAPWTTIEHSGVLDNGAGTPDHLHVIMLEEGECLIDDVEVIPSGGANRIANATFETGLSGWVARGDHERSSLASVGFNSSRSLHVRASARGDIGPNKIRVPCSALTVGQTATVRAKARWLRGWPEILFRIRGSYLEATDRMMLPTNLGTPGAPNSRLVANSGPAITEVLHTPVVPAANQAVVVSARISDIDGLGSVAVRYRVDPATNLVAVPMNDVGVNGDMLAGDGVFSATLPGQPANTILAFVVEASDAADSPASRFPALRNDNGPARECLVHFGSPIPAGGFGTYRFWITQQSITNWSQREVLSNERIPGTFVYGNHRVIYESGSRYSGSAAHQDQAAPDYSPVGTPNNYTFDMPKDELLLGTDNFNKVHGAGNNHHDDNTLIREVVAYWMAQEMGLPANYKRFVAMYINGARRGSLMEDTQVPNGEVIASVFPDDAEGDLYKVSVWYEFGSVNTPQSLPYTGASEAYLNNYTTSGGGKKRARYRWNWQPRAVHGTANDFTNLFQLVDAANTPAGPAFTQNMDGLADVENWMRTFALEHALGNWDSFGYRNEQNMFAYKPERGRWSLLIWDINIIFGGGTRGTPVATNDNLFEIDTADAPMNTLYSTPVYRRAYWQALKEIAEGPFVNANADRVMDARFEAFEASGIYVTAPNLIKIWIKQRRAYIVSELARVDAAGLVINGSVEFTSPTNLITLGGTAPVGIRTIEVNGIAWPVTWTTVTNWTMRVPLAQATNQFIFLGYDSRGNLVAGASNRLAILYTGPIFLPQDYVTINEIMYNPGAAGASFVEIFNRSPNYAFDSSRWRVSGLDYTFPSGSILSNQQMLVLTKDRTAFIQSYGGSVSVFGEFDGNLDSDGETISLIKPGIGPEQDIIIDRVRYEPRAPWLPAANGSGPSLQLIDAAQDNARVSNWSDGSGWKFFSFTANLAAGTNQFRLYLGAVGEIYVDDLWLVAGLVSEGGENLIRNGDFEGPLLTNDSGPWQFSQPSLSNTVISTEIRHSGNGSLRLVHLVPGPSAYLTQNGIIITAPGPHTMSFWYWPITNNTTLTAYVNASFRPSANVRRVFASPAVANSSVALLPAYDPLWLNELQAENTTGPVDNFNEREPWIELYNAGTNSIELHGYYLANNYTSNLIRWAFPPGATLAPGQFGLVWADGEPGESSSDHWHTSFRLNSVTGSVALVRLVDGQPQITDYLTYANLGAALSYGDFPDGQPFTRRIFQSVTPGATNRARSVDLFINEWMASNTSAVRDPTDQAFDDWFEIYNAGAEAVDLAGYWLSDVLANPNGGFRVPAGGQYRIPPNGFLLVWADEDSSDNREDVADLHVNFRLSATRDDIGLFAPDLTLIDRVSFSNEVGNISSGRFADGANAIYAMTNPTPRAPNVVGGNSAPQLGVIPNKTVTLGQSLSFTVLASDPDAPPQVLSFNLEGDVPAGAAITADGLFTWTPSTQQAPSTNTFIVRVADNGFPPASATRPFTVFVALPPRLADVTRQMNGQISMRWDTIPGKTYRIEYSDNLEPGSWQRLADDEMATGSHIIVTDQLNGIPQRFYRIAVLD
ncbi:MAG: lamin tail domain-containing protein [Verrucomicrobia subdivision 3 bacterium]|nr:lamin tail domain-containing protein [Limisphaerales bacterium]